MNKERDPQARRGGRADPRPRRVPRPQAEGALRRPAPARGDGPGDRPRAAGVPDGRAAVEPRRQAARADPHPDRRAAAPARRHHRLRHPRPGRGDDHGRPRRACSRTASCSRSTRRATSTTARPTCSWPGSSARPAMNLVDVDLDGRGRGPRRPVVPAAARRRWPRSPRTARRRRRSASGRRAVRAGRRGRGLPVRGGRRRGTRLGRLRLRHPAHLARGAAPATS